VYGVLLGWRIGHSEMPVPLTDNITPLLELDGQSPFSAAGDRTRYRAWRA